jgi:hypothetical protein
MKPTRSLALLFLATGFNVAPAQTYTFTTLAGSPGNAGSVDGAGSAARLIWPYGVAVDASGNIFVTDGFGGDLVEPSSTIRKITAGGVVTTFAGSTSSGGSADGTGSAAQFSGATGLAVDGSGNLFVADRQNSLIRKVTPAGVVTTAAVVTETEVGGGGFDPVTEVAVDANSNLFIVQGTRVRKITTGGVLTTIAGSARSHGYADGMGSAARFESLAGIAVDGSGNLFVTDFGNATIRKISAAGAVTTFAGLAGVRGSEDGIGGAARFQAPTGVAVDRSGNLFVTDSRDYRIAGSGPTIRKITAAGVVTTLAGSPSSNGSADGTGSAARFAYPIGVAVDASGNVFVADNGTHTIRKGVPAAIAPIAFSGPQSQHVNVGAAATFTAAQDGSEFYFQWKKDGVAIAGATRAAYQISPVAVSDTGFYSVVVNGPGAPIESPVAILTVATSSTSRLSNFSAHGLVPSGGDLTVGFVVRGRGDKSVLVRAIGPALGSFGVSGTLADPRLDLIPVGASAAMNSNDDWGGGAALAGSFASAGAFALPAASKDAALVGTLAVADYTARVTSNVAGGSGTALTEVYDRDPIGGASRFANLSTLGFVGTGAQALMLGFVIDGEAPKRLLIRAVGPGLAPLGVTGVLGDPEISIIPLGKTFSVASNDNWGGEMELIDAFLAAGTFALPGSSKDAAVVLRLPPGGYAVTVSGVGAATGRALVEIYDLAP